MHVPPIESLLASWLDDCARWLRDRPAPPALVGIRSGGAWLAERLATHIGQSEPVGLLDISFYRDDFSRIGLQPEVRPSLLPLDLEDREVLLIDDILHTGRTVRAAMNELFDWGRPSAIRLSVLIERNGRELPIQADLAGARITLPANAQIKLRGPQPLSLELVERP